MSKENFVSKTLELLKLERDAEIEETTALHDSLPSKELQRRGLCLLKLRIGERKSGLYGRSIVAFESFWERADLPSHGFSAGDIAGVSTGKGAGEQKDVLASGIVTRVTSRNVLVAFDESFDNLDLEDETQYQLLKLANDVTYQRLKRALDNLQKDSNNDSRHLVDLLFGDAEPWEPMPSLSPELKYFNNNLDESQREAVRFSLCQKDAAVVHGPPGTGKTTTVVEIIRQAVKANQKVLACAPSNIAVDNLVERLGPHCRVVRLGHPARLLPGIQKHSLDAILAASDDSQIVQDVRKDLDKTLSSLHKARDTGEKRSIRSNLRSLRQELKQREERAVQNILQKAEVVLATLTGASLDGPLKQLRNANRSMFDIVVIDENSQALEAACWIALPYAPRCILAGDHHQLPPTIMSNKAAEDGLAVTLMERVIKMFGDTVVCMLTTQYRMHEDIMKFSSDQLYEGRLKAAPSVEKHVLKDLAGVLENEDTSTALLLIDTAGCDFEELDLPDELSKGNEGEVEVVKCHLENLISSGVQPADIAVIAPYNLQVDMLRLRLLGQYPQLEIKSVDGFQGREKEAVVISLVRSNTKGEVGFLAEDRRINVAITRARRHLAVICDSVTVSRHDFLASLVAYMMDHGDVRSACKYREDFSFNGERLTIIDRQMDLAIYKVKQEEKRKKAKEGRKPSSKAMKRKNQPEQNAQAASQSTAKEEEEEEENQNIRMSELQQEIDEFLAQENASAHSFPSSLTSQDRFMVHQLCEDLGLAHISHGKGSDRHIVIQKQSEQSKTQRPVMISPSKLQYSTAQGKTTVCTVTHKKVDPMCTSETSVADDQSQTKKVSDQLQTKRKSGTESDQKSSVTDASSIMTCPDCGNSVPIQNTQLHTLWCQGQHVSSEEEVTPEPSEDVKQTEKHQKSSKKKKNKKQGKQTPHKDKEPEDDDSVLNAAIKQNKRCAMKGCKKSVVTFNLWCSYCNGKFCSEHFLAEEHGCGNAAKAAARRTINREGKLFPGSGVPDKKPNAVQRNQLKRKLDSKLNQLADKRKGNKPQK